MAHVAIDQGSWLTFDPRQLFTHKYQLTDRCLGQGAEGSVYLAIDSNTKKQLVCKVVNLDKLQGRHGREQLWRKFQEVDILRQLQHVRAIARLQKGAH